MPHRAAPPSAVTLDAGYPLYSCPAWLQWASASQWVAAWVAMANTSSLKAMNSGSGPSGLFTWIIVRVGFTRPSTNPSWIPSASDKGSPSPKACPDTTAAAPRRRAASSIRLSVPSSSSGPHRPQLRTRAATSVNAVESATRAPYRRPCGAPPDLRLDDPGPPWRARRYRSVVPIGAADDTEDSGGPPDRSTECKPQGGIAR